MFLHKRLTQPATALLVAAVGVALFALPATSVSTGSPVGARTKSQAGPQEALPASNLLLIENAGQWPAAARFQAWGSPAGVGTTWLAEDAIWISIVTGSQDDELPRFPADLSSVQRTAAPLTGLALKLTFPGASPDVRIEPLNPLTTTVSYFLGNEPAQWRSDVPVFSGVRYADLYPGIDLVLDGRDAFWRFEAAPGAETTPVQVRIEGAEILAINGGTVRLASQEEPREILLPRAPFDYQANGVSPQGEVLALAVHPSVDAFPQPDAPDDDPGDLIYATFLGGSSPDQGIALALDAAGRATVTGDTYSSDFPTTPGAFDLSFEGDEDAFVVRLNATGSALDYATFLGGSDREREYGLALALDAAGRATVTGWTFSSDFPTTPSAFDRSYNGGDGDAFVVRLNATGSALDYATFLGGSGGDYGLALALDTAGRATVTGQTRSSDFPTTPSAFDRSYNGGASDAFVVRLNATGSALDYATFLGGSNYEFGSALALDAAGRATVTGYTYSSDFPTTPGAFDRSYNGGDGDAFVVRLNAAGSALDYATFLGGSASDGGHALALDAAGRATVTGDTYSSDFPTTPGAFDLSFEGIEDAFVVRLNATGSALDYATFLGGRDFDVGYALALDAAGRATVTGVTLSSDFPTTPGAFDRSYNGGDGDAFVVRLNATGSALDYATFLGGSGGEHGLALALDTAGRATVTGHTGSSDFPTTPGAFDRSYNGGYADAFVAVLRLSESMPLSIWHSEAEAGTRTGSMQLGTDSAASACQYVYDPVSFSGSTITYNVTVPYTDDYFLWARSKGASWNNNSFFVSVDGAPNFHFEITPVDDQWIWKWQIVYDITQPIVAFNLAAGTHTVRFESREPLAKLDALVLVNSSPYTPSQFTPCEPTATPTPTITRSRTPTSTPTARPTSTPVVRYRCYLPLILRHHGVLEEAQRVARQLPADVAEFVALLQRAVALP